MTGGCGTWNTSFSVNNAGKCPRCGAESLPYTSYCRACRNAYARDRRPHHSALPEDERRKSNCRAYTNVLIRRGKLQRGPCSDCGSTVNVEAHHEDYSKPRDVRWICRLCHRAHHRKPTTLEGKFYSRWLKRLQDKPPAG